MVFFLLGRGKGFGDLRLAYCGSFGGLGFYHCSRDRWIFVSGYYIYGVGGIIIFFYSDSEA